VAQWFGSFLHWIRRRLGCESNSTGAQSVTNMIWLLLPVLDWLIIMIGSGGLLRVVSPPICIPSFIFIGGVGRK
jgi:hypothetical protein